jgi:hypothetical protein
VCPVNAGEGSGYPSEFRDFEYTDIHDPYVGYWRIVIMQPKADYILRGPPITQRRYINSRIPNLKIKWLSACAARSKAMMMVRWSNIFTVRYSTPPGQLAVKIWRVSKTAKESSLI